MRHKTCLAAALCAALALGCASPALAGGGGATSMEGTTAVMVRLEPAARQEAEISTGGGADAPDAADGPIRSVRRIQALLRTGDAPTFALSAALTLASGMLACVLCLEGRSASPTSSGEGCRRSREEGGDHAR